ncbi:ABC transporter permease [Rubrobacter taiwanensis]|uniref:ABC transporter permease n=1 Tax=Rubrobacter taiwanensis TaxID=185139 RepID=A0A4R1BEV5_9ACTN|nr:ABC transporter permease [Rubrobacter taiwanensis]TCJ15660.1 ABC transporter permease [Rubrobacter taiwanensis]
MLAYIIRKILFSIIILFVASFVIFYLVSLSGDPLQELALNPRVSQEDIERLAATYGLDQPVYVQYGIWIRDILLYGDFGLSFKQNTDVNSIIAARIWPTVLLMGSSLIFTLAIAIPFGIYSAIKKYSLIDNIGTFLSFVGFAMPVFFLGLILQLVFAVYLTEWLGVRVFYVSGMSSRGGGVIDLLQHLFLPMVTLSVVSIATFTRFQRSAMLDVLSAEYLRTARAKGLSERTVYLKHALRNALIPTITLIALSAVSLIAGAVITETVFSWPGLGFLLIDSLYKGDYNVARALLLITAVLTVLFNLLADIAYSIVDPRVSYD